MRQTATGSRWAEVDSRQPGSVLTLSADASGAVLTSGAVPLGSGLPDLAFEGVLLPSPVRANAQTVLFDRRIEDARGDFDGDGRGDRLDIAAWQRVIGNERITPPDGTTALTALRVETTLTLRVTYTGGSEPATRTNRQITWYAPGVGAIRQAVESAQPGRPYPTEDWLLGYDGIDRGWGWVRREPVPLDNVTTFPPTSALATPDGVLAAAGRSVLDFDKSGRLRAVHPIPRQGNFPVVASRLLRFGGGLRAIDRLDSSRSSQLVPLAADGRPVSAPIPVEFGRVPRPGWQNTLESSGPDAADGANRAWTAWLSLELEGGPGREIVLQAMDADGGFVTPELRIPAGNHVNLSSLRVAGRLDGAVVQWQEGDAQDLFTRLRMVIVDDSGRVLVDRAYEVGSIGRDRFFRPLTEGSDLWWLWRQPPATGLDQEQNHALRIDPRTGDGVGAPVTAATLAAARVAAVPGAAWGNLVDRTAAKGGRWFIAGEALADRFPELQQALETVIDFGELDPGTGPAGGAGVTRDVMTVRIPAAAYSTVAPPIVFDDRVILLTARRDVVQPIVIWRR